MKNGQPLFFNYVLEDDTSVSTFGKHDEISKPTKKLEAIRHTTVYPVRALKFEIWDGQPLLFNYYPEDEKSVNFWET